MTIPAAQDVSLGFIPGDHVCAFYSSSQHVLDDVRNGVDIREWFAAESELNMIVPDFPHFFFCLYDLDLFDGDTVMYVLRTHPRVYVNGIIIGNPHYQAERLVG
jgi:hypothetical protein